MFDLARNESNRVRCPSSMSMEQITFCKRNPEALMTLIAQGYKRAITNCEKQFSNEK